MKSLAAARIDFGKFRRRKGGVRLETFINKLRAIFC